MPKTLVIIALLLSLLATLIVIKLLILGGKQASGLDELKLDLSKLY